VIGEEDVGLIRSGVNAALLKSGIPNSLANLNLRVFNQTTVNYGSHEEPKSK
jgi:hypothetical protein